MADPVLAGGIRVLHIWQGASGLPEDRYVNTFAFASDAAQSDVAKLAAIEKVQRFYDTTYNGTSLHAFLSSEAVDETASESRAYSMEDPVNGRVPVIVPWSTTQGNLSSAAALPSEVAVCGSYYCGTNTPRNRGRIYLGPLATTALAPSNGAGLVKAELQQCLLAAMLDLAQDDAGPRWSLLAMGTTSTRQLKIITNCWVDNAFDTQRRRGETATARVTGAVV
jgi:hypothetical protein